MPRAERRGALEGSKVGLAFRFEGTLDGGALVCVFCLVFLFSIGASLGSGASALAICFGGLEFAPWSIDPAGCDSVVADFLGGMLVGWKFVEMKGVFVEVEVMFCNGTVLVHRS